MKITIRTRYKIVSVQSVTICTVNLMWELLKDEIDRLSREIDSLNVILKVHEAYSMQGVPDRVR